MFVVRHRVIRLFQIQYPIRRFNRNGLCSVSSGTRIDSVSKASPPPVVQPTWTDPEFGSQLDVQRQIFCNRSLTMDSIKAVGFDMDYTLAQYKPETFETMTHDETINKLITLLNYPEEISNFSFDCYYMMRGLIVDKKRGNILKIDRHKYVKLAYHGFRSLSRNERHVVYGLSELREPFDEPDYTMIDTLFAISEAHLFMSLVELKDSKPSLLAHKTYEDMYKDVRFAIDYSHRDGTLKKKVAEDPSYYIHEDPHLIPLFEMLRQSGKSLFLATNSLWDYTNIAMNFLISKNQGRNCNLEWLRHFDVVITGCEKPRFFNSGHNLFIVDPKTGNLLNTDNGAPTASLHHEFPEKDLDHSSSRVYQGGTYLDLHRMLGIKSGTEVLFVGDHIYGDILRSKKTLGWRTMLVVPELEAELSILTKCQDKQNKLLSIRKRRNAIEDKVQRLKWFLKSNSNGLVTDLDSSPEEIENIIAQLDQEKENLSSKHTIGLQELHEKFHPIWGRLLKTGYQNSLLAHQIDRFACLYTSHVGNLVFYSPYKRYRGRVDHMAHEDFPDIDKKIDSEF
eukprot:g8869.t1